MPAIRTLVTTSAACLALSGLGTMATAADGDGGYSIVRHGNWLLVTAPDNGTHPELKARLSQKVTVDFVDSNLDDIAAFLRAATSTNIVVAPGARLAAPPVTFKAEGMSLGNVIEWVRQLAKVHVNFVHGAIYFSDQPAAGASVTRLHDITDLTMKVRDFAGPELGFAAGGTKGGKGGGGAFDLFAAGDKGHDAKDQTADDIVELIKKHVKPEAWNK